MCSTGERNILSAHHRRPAVWANLPRHPLPAWHHIHPFIVLSPETRKAGLGTIPSAGLQVWEELCWRIVYFLPILTRRVSLDSMWCNSLQRSPVLDFFAPITARSASDNGGIRLAPLRFLMSHTTCSLARIYRGRSIELASSYGS